MPQWSTKRAWADVPALVRRLLRPLVRALEVRGGYVDPPTPERGAVLQRLGD